MKDETTIGYRFSKVDDGKAIDRDTMSEMSAELSCYLRSISKKYKDVNHVKILVHVEVTSVDENEVEVEVDENEVEVDE